MSDTSARTRVVEWQQKAMTEMYEDICSVIIADQMLTWFQGQSIISVDDKESIRQGSPTRKMLNEKFLDLVVHRNFNQGKTTAYDCFLQYCIEKRAYPKLKDDLCAAFNRLKSEEFVAAPPPVDDCQNLTGSDGTFSPGTTSSHRLDTTADLSSLAGSTGSQSIMSSRDLSSSLTCVDDEFSPGTQTSTPCRQSTVCSTTGRTQHSFPSTSGNRPPSMQTGASASAESPLSSTPHFNPHSLPTRQSTGGYSTSATSDQGSVLSKPSDCSTPCTQHSLGNGKAVFPQTPSGLPPYTNEERDAFQPSMTTSTPIQNTTHSEHLTANSDGVQ